MEISVANLEGVQQLGEAQQRHESEPARDQITPKWPVLDAAALHGVAGRYVRKLEPCTEADPTAILIQFLVMVGSVIGRGSHFKVEADEHHLNLFAVMVGESAKGRKGVSVGQAKRLFKEVDPFWSTELVVHGLSSGEGLIWKVRDPDENPPGEDSKRKKPDQGIQDKRLLVIEPEFASMLKVLKREGNTLSPVVRNSWDSGDLRILTKNSPAVATGAHISIIGHITKHELLRYLETTETANGFGNRFLWCCVRRSKFLPEGGRAHELSFAAEISELVECIQRAQSGIELRRDAEAKDLWFSIYRDLSEGKPGLLGSMIGRAEAQTMRLACLYALLDQSAEVRAEHLLAALALWTYCEASAAWIFGDKFGDPLADEILRALRQSPEGLARTEIGDWFSRHLKKGQIGRALDLLLDQNLARAEMEPTEGRPRQRWLAVYPDRAKSELSE